MKLREYVVNTKIIFKDMSITFENVPKNFKHLWENLFQFPFDKQKYFY